MADTEERVRTLTLAIHPGQVVTLGRAPDNDVILTEAGVDWHHVLLSRRGDDVWVEDVGSRYGTWLDGDRVLRPTRVTLGAFIRIGMTYRALLSIKTPPGGHGEWAVEVVESGALFSLPGDAIELGPTGRLPLCASPARLQARGARSFRLEADGKTDTVKPLVPFMVAGHTLVVRNLATLDHTPGDDVSGGPFPYRLDATFDADGRPHATIFSLRSDLRHIVRSENESSLLHFLARALDADIHEGAGKTEAGWRKDSSSLAAVWGRDWRSMSPNLLHVLIHRLRAELAGAGFDPRAIQKADGMLRFFIEEPVTVGEPAIGGEAQ